MGTKIKFPKTNVPIIGADSDVQPSDQRVLFIGQVGSNSTIGANKWYRDLPVAKNELQSLLGDRSMSFQMVRDARVLNKDVSFDILTVEATTGTNASAPLKALNTAMGANITGSTAAVTLTTLVTVSKVGHGLINNDYIALSGATSDPAILNGQHKITFIDVDNFSFNVVGATNGAVTGTLVINKLLGAQISGELVLCIGSQTNGAYKVLITEGDSYETVCGSINAAINSASYIDRPFTSTYVFATNNDALSIASSHVGDIYNQAPIYVESQTEGLGFTFELTAFSGGASDLDLTTVFDAIGDVRYQTVVWPYVNDLEIAQAFMDSRFNADGEVLDGVVVTGKADTFSNLKAFGNTFNSNSVVVLGTERTGTNAFNDIVESPWNIAAQFCAIRSLRLQVDTNIANFVIANGGALDSIGGPALASKPYANTPMPSLKKSLDGQGFDKLEIKELNDAGVSVLGNNKAGNGVILGMIVTTYKNDNAGNPDLTYKYLNYVDTASTGREFIFASLEKDNAQSRLTSGALLKGRTMTNAETISAKMVQYYQELAESEYVIARKGDAELAFFKENLVVTVDLETGTALIFFKLPIVTQLRVINAPMALSFNI